MKRWNVLSKSVFNPFVIASLIKFRIKDKLNKLHGLSLCAITVLNMIFEWLPHLCTPHIQLSVRSFSWAVDFKHRFNHKDLGDVPMPRKEGHLLVNKKADIKCPFWAWWRLSLHFGCCINTPSHYKDTGVLLSFRRGRKPLKDFTMRPMVTLIQLEWKEKTEDGSTNIVVTP